MRILFCNKYNHPFSGTEVYLFELIDLLRAHGHEAALFSMVDPAGEPTAFDRHFIPHVNFKDAGLWKKARQAARAIYSLEARRRIRRMIAEFRPDVAHVRNIYHHLTPSILWELKTQKVPVLYHVNDFKLLCPSYNLVSQGEACEACKGGAFWHALRSRCYPGWGERVTLAAEAYTHRILGSYRRCVDLFLAPSQFVRDKFVEHGWDAARFEVLPHFQKVHSFSAGDQDNNAPVVYCGRLSAEKGIADLLRAASGLPELRFVIAGDGPQRRELENLAKGLGIHNVQFTGQISASERDALIAQSRFTVLPTYAYETLGKAILESYAQARAVIATDTGSRRELIRHGETGLLYGCGDVKELTASILALAADPVRAQAMGREGWDWVRQHRTPEKHYAKLISLYEGLASARALTVRHLCFKGDDAEDEQVKVAGTKAQAIPKLRIAFIGGRGVISKYSGIESYYEEVGRNLAAMGHDVTVYCRNYFTPAVPEHNGMKLVRLPTVRSKHLETLVHTFLSTCHALVCSYDVVHYHALGSALFACFPRIRGTKTAVTVQGLDWQRKKWGVVASAVLRLGERASAWLPNQTMVVSRVLQERYRTAHEKETIYIPNGGILRDRKTPRTILEWGLDPGRYVLFLGRFSPEKECHLLVKAFELIETDVKLVMAGASSYCDEYSRELRTHASERIRMLDWVSGETLHELLTNAMIFVLPSELEGLSLALLDAMGAGLCVLTSDVPENREVVEGVGFTFRTGNAEDLAERLRFLIANPSARTAAANIARKKIEEQYQWHNIARQIEKAYYEMLGWTFPVLTEDEIPVEKADVATVA